jgi:hypothetical protein
MSAAEAKTGKSTMAMRAAIASSIGAALEWIDFTAYGALSATVFGRCNAGVNPRFFAGEDADFGKAERRDC